MRRGHGVFAAYSKLQAEYIPPRKKSSTASSMAMAPLSQVLDLASDDDAIELGAAPSVRLPPRPTTVVALPSITRSTYAPVFSIDGEDLENEHDHDEFRLSSIHGAGYLDFCAFLCFN